MELPAGYEEQIETYEQRFDVELLDSLGTGTQGTVFTALRPRYPFPFAVKIHLRQVAYKREVEVYLRLQNLNISEVCGHHVPQLLHYFDELLAIEMTIVSPPFWRTLREGQALCLVFRHASRAKEPTPACSAPGLKRNTEHKA